MTEISANSTGRLQKTKITWPDSTSSSFATTTPVPGSVVYGTASYSTGSGGGWATVTIQNAIPGQAYQPSAEQVFVDPVPGGVDDVGGEDGDDHDYDDTMVTFD